MNNVSFVLWVLLFPLSIRMNSYISFLMGRATYMRFPVLPCA